MVTALAVEQPPRAAEPASWGLLDPGPATAGAHPAGVAPGPRRLRGLLDNLAHPPLADRRFWYAQGLVAVVLAVQLVADLAQDRGATSIPGFVWLLALFLPVIYAGTAFGLVGSLATALEGTLVVLPKELSSSHSQVALWAALSTIAMVNLCALLLGDRFERERLERDRLLREERSRIAARIEGHPLSWRRLLEMIPEGIALVDEAGSVRFANEQLEGLSGYTRDELLGTAFDRLVPAAGGGDGNREGPDVTGMSARIARRALLARKDGAELPADVLLEPVLLEGHRWQLVAVRDDRARQEAERAQAEAERREREKVGAAARALAVSEERFRLTFESNMSGVVVVDLEDRALGVNPAFCELVGYSEEELIGKTSALFTSPEDVARTNEVHARLLSGELQQATYTKRYRHKNGNLLWVDVQKAAAHDDEGAIAYFVSSVRDVTNQHVLTSRLNHQARHDPLTGLANRRHFEERLSAALVRAAAEEASLAVMLLDLDNFKGINDTLGHQLGDELLVAIARRLGRVTRRGDTLSRLGGDEFLYLAEDVASPSDAQALAERLLATLDEPLFLAGHRLDQRASLGIALWTADDQLAFPAPEATQTLLRNADIALYEAKHQGKGRLVLFTTAMREQVASHFELAQALGRALACREISMHYQPIVRLETGEPVGFEALMRWDRPGLGPVPPSTFIPLAERSDRILDLGAFALREAVAQAVSWRATGPGGRPLEVAVNVSPRQLFAPRFLSDVAGLLSEVGLAPERLVLEVTEGTLLSDVARASQLLEDLGRRGVRVAIDDFGTGYSSLSRLARLRPSILKIDRSFVSPDRPLASTDPMLETMLALGSKLEMTIVAEGIETTDQRDHLLALGCELGQGYLFSPALPQRELRRLLGRAPARPGAGRGGAA